MTTVVTRGAASAQALGYAARATAANYIEDVFSTYLYTGNGSTQTITNGIDLSTKGGMVWIKSRSDTNSHGLWDTSRGVGTGSGSTTNKALSSNSTAAEGLGVNAHFVSSFNATGFNVDVGTSVGAGNRLNNQGSVNYASWTFRKQAKFFDVVTWAGDGTEPRNITHNLGSTPGCIIVKRIDQTGGDWYVYHRSLTSAAYSVRLNATSAQSSTPFLWYSTAPTAAVFTVGADNVNQSGSNYVAYLFAHDAGGFGASGTDNVISCGSFTGTGSDVTVNLGYEPQWLLVKRATGGTDNWALFDNMRGMFVNFEDNILFPNLSNAEVGPSSRIAPTSTGFIGFGGVYAASSTYIYIAIRRGPMKTPTSGTSVFAPVARNGTGTNTTITSAGFPVDLTLSRVRSSVSGYSFAFFDRMRGRNNVLFSNSTASENTSVTNALTGFDVMNGVSVGDDSTLICINDTDAFSTDFFRRAPGFFDVVCYTGTGASATLNHNLGVSPEMVIIKGRSIVSNWETYLSSLGGTSGNGLALNDSGPKSGTPPVSSATATTFTLNNGVSTSNGQTYVAYLFATVAGVSKVGSYTGTGALQTINCGFTSGARFVLIKRTNSTGDWYVYDSARGITSGSDPYIFLNSTAAEVTGTNYVDTDTTGFKVTAAAPAGLNASGGTYIFLAIA